MKTYNEILNSCSSDKGTNPERKEVNGNGYGELYGYFFEKHRYTAKNICDVGILDGASLYANKEYFENATIHGLDIFDKSHFAGERIETYKVDQSMAEDLIKFKEKMISQGITFDVIIDDGSHDVSHQQLTLGILFDLVSPGGLYIIEDLCTSYFVEGTNLMGYVQTSFKRDFSTVKFLQNRPFMSPWINPETATKIDDQVLSVTILDNSNKYRNLPYTENFHTINNYPARSITSILQKAK